MENKPQMPAQPLSNAGQSSLSSESGNAPSGQDYSQMLTQPLSNAGQSSLSSEPGNAPSGQDYSQMPPNQSYQQVSPQPDQAVQPTGLPRVSRRGRELIMMLLGVILAIGGIVLSVISYTSASSAVNNGGTGNYIIFTGPIVVGTICAIVGFFRWILRR
jgi:hypothetical protein